MGTYSYFAWERNVRLRDREFYEYLKTVAAPDSAARAVTEWYDTFGKPITFDRPKKCRKWRRVVEGDQLRFSFACLNGWRLYYPEFNRLMRAMEHFLLRSGGVTTGAAHFTVDGNPDCEFRIDYRRGTIHYMEQGAKPVRPWANEKLRIPKHLPATGTRVPPPRDFVERPSLDVLMGLKKKPKRPPKRWRISVADATVIEQFGSNGRLKTRRRTFARPQLARLQYYRAIKAKSGSFSDSGPGTNRR